MTVTRNSDSARRITNALHEADRLRAAGRPELAERTCREILAAYPEQVAALNFLALLVRDRGDLAEAEALFRRGIEMAPDEPNLRNNYGNLQRLLGDLAGAEASLRKAIRLKAVYPEAYLNLGVTLGDMGRHEEAVAALRRATSQRPGYADALMHIGLQFRKMDQNEEALRSIDAALTAQPAHFAAHYNRGDVLLALKRFDDALAAFDAALRLNPASMEARYARANTLARTGRHDEALETYRQVIETTPEVLAAHQQYNALAWTTGHEDLNFTSFAIARSKLGNMPDLMLMEAEQRLRFKQNAEAEQLLRQASELAPERVDIVNALGRSISAQGRFEESLDVLQDAAYRAADSADFQRDLAVALLRANRPAESMRILERALTHAPHDQLLLAFLALTYRELGDSRLTGLVDHGKYVRVYDLPPPAGFADASSYNNELAEELMHLHTRKVEPFDQSLRGGTQTTGDLFDERSRALALLKESIDAAIADYAASLPDDPENPVAARKSSAFEYTGSWSCRLRNGGFHDNHVHHKGWISSAYYAALPEATKDKSAQQGWLKFGESNIALSDRDRPEQLVQPTVGKLVLFPSYYWHGTVPFASDDARMTVAFDVVPKPTAKK